MKTKIRLLITLALIVIFPFFVAPADAQDNLPVQCNPTGFFNVFSTILPKNSAALETDMYLKFLRELRVLLDSQWLLCNGMTFSGNGAKLLGPIDLPAGLYRVTLTTTGYFSAKLEVITGDCESTGLIGLYGIFEGQANEGSETLIKSSGCTTLIDTSNVTDTWTLTIEPLQ